MIPDNHWTTQSNYYIARSADHFSTSKVSSKGILLLCGAALTSVLRSQYHAWKFGLALFLFKLPSIPRVSITHALITEGFGLLLGLGVFLQVVLLCSH